MTCVDQSDRPRDNTDWSWRDITPLLIPGACGKVCNTSQTAKRKQTAHFEALNASWKGRTMANKGILDAPLCVITLSPSNTSPPPLCPSQRTLWLVWMTIATLTVTEVQSNLFNSGFFSFNSNLSLPNPNPFTLFNFSICVVYLSYYWTVLLRELGKVRIPLYGINHCDFSVHKTINLLNLNLTFRGMYTLIYCGRHKWHWSCWTHNLTKVTFVTDKK